MKVNAFKGNNIEDSEGRTRADRGSKLLASFPVLLHGSDGFGLRAFENGVYITLLEPDASHGAPPPLRCEFIIQGQFGLVNGYLVQCWASMRLVDA